jgi:hypothetical protein
MDIDATGLGPGIEPGIGLTDQREKVFGDEPEDHANDDEDEAVLEEGVAGHVEPLFGYGTRISNGNRQGKVGAERRARATPGRLHAAFVSSHISPRSFQFSSGPSVNISSAPSEIVSNVPGNLTPKTVVWVRKRRLRDAEDNLNKPESILEQGDVSLGWPM